MRTLNMLNKKTGTNRSKTNIESVKKLQVEFSKSAELHNLLFVVGASTNTLSDCVSLSNSPKTNTYPMVVRYNDNCLKTVFKIANVFNFRFSGNFSNTVVPRSEIIFFVQVSIILLMISLYFAMLFLISERCEEK